MWEIIALADSEELQKLCTPICILAFKLRPKTFRFSFCNVYFDFIVIQANLVILALVLKEICRLQTSQRTCMSEIVR